MTAEVRPIRSPRDYEAALGEAERLWGAKTGTREGDRLDVLATLIDAYEADHHPMDPPDSIEAIKFRMEQQGLTRRDLEALIGTRTRIVEIQEIRSVGPAKPWGLGRANVKHRQCQPELEGGCVNLISESRLAYLFSPASGSDFGLNGVTSSSSRQTTRFLNFQPCGVFTRVSS
jgi:HTH-type transcriptional regulator / antitoxin HigA